MRAAEQKVRRGTNFERAIVEFDGGANFVGRFRLQLETDGDLHQHLGALFGPGSLCLSRSEGSTHLLLCTDRHATPSQSFHLCGRITFFVGR